MPVVNGRLTCCTCGADLGDASDPYRDPTCMACENDQGDTGEWDQQSDEQDDGYSREEQLADMDFEDPYTDDRGEMYDDDPNPYHGTYSED